MTQKVTPYLLYEDGEAAIEFLTRAFGFRLDERTTGAAGGLHAELEVDSDGGWVHLGQPPRGFRNPAVVGRTSLVYVIVDDIDAHHERATAAGAHVIEELNDQPYAVRRYGCSDPQGHEWYFAQPITPDGRDA